MTDAEKFAKVFRAAADGISRKIEADDDRRGWTTEGGVDRIMHAAFCGIAEMFEKIVEAEKLAP